MWLAPWQIFLLGMLTSIFVIMVFIIIVAIAHIRPSRVIVERLEKDEEEENENGGEN